MEMQFWSNIAQEPRYITYAAIVLDAFAVIFIVLSSLQKGPIGSRFSGKRRYDFRFDGMAELAQAHRREVDR